MKYMFSMQIKYLIPFSINYQLKVILQWQNRKKNLQN